MMVRAVAVVRGRVNRRMVRAVRGEVVLVVLGIVAGHITAQLQARFHERVHGGHARGVFSLLLPAHLLLPALAGQTTPHILPLQLAPNQTTLKD